MVAMREGLKRTILLEVGFIIMTWCAESRAGEVIVLSLDGIMANCLRSSF